MKKVIELIHNVILAKHVLQHCPACGLTDSHGVAMLELTGDNRVNTARAFVAWCPCGAVFNQDNIVLIRENSP